MLRTLIILSIPIAAIVGIVLLQIYLSKRERMWPGLILPIICLSVSLIAVLNIATSAPITSIGSGELTAENGTVIQEITPEVIIQVEHSTSSIAFTVASVLILYNIPTAILLAICLACRKKRQQKKALEKMQALDLE